MRLWIEFSFASKFKRFRISIETFSKLFWFDRRNSDLFRKKWGAIMIPSFFGKNLWINPWIRWKKWGWNFGGFSRSFTKSIKNVSCWHSYKVHVTLDSWNCLWNSAKTQWHNSKLMWQLAAHFSLSCLNRNGKLLWSKFTYLSVKSEKRALKSHLYLV